MQIPLHILTVDTGDAVQARRRVSPGVQDPVHGVLDTEQEPLPRNLDVEIGWGLDPGHDLRRLRTERICPRLIERRVGALEPGPRVGLQPARDLHLQLRACHISVADHHVPQLNLLVRVDDDVPALQVRTELLGDHGDDDRPEVLHSTAQLVGMGTHKIRAFTLGCVAQHSGQGGDGRPGGVVELRRQVAARRHALPQIAAA